MNLYRLHYESDYTRSYPVRKKLYTGVAGLDTSTEQGLSHSIDRYFLIWYDTEGSSERNIRLQTSLKAIINDVFVYQDLAHVEAKIQRSKGHRVYVIFNGNVDKSLINRVHRRSQVAALYIYYRRPHRYEHVRLAFPKLKQISNDFVAISKSLKGDVYVYEKVDNSRFTTIAHEDSEEHSQNQNNLIRLWESFENDQPSLEAKNTMMHTLRDYYQHNESMISVLNEFENTLRPLTAINWYTQETLLHRFLNNAFRTYDWDLLNKLQYFIHCLCIQLIREQSSFMEKFSNNPIITVYRSQFISHAEFDRLVTQTSNTLFLPCFVLGTLQESTALSLINKSEPSSHDMRVLFKITIDTRIQGTQPYADISHLSTHPDEQEVMIMFGARFRVVDILLNTSRKMPLILLDLCPSREDNEAVPSEEDEIADTLESEQTNEYGWD